MTPTNSAPSKRIALLTVDTILLAVAGGASASHTPSPTKIIHPIRASACTHSPPRDGARLDEHSDRPDRCRIVEEPAAD